MSPIEPTRPSAPTAVAASPSPTQTVQPDQAPVPEAPVARTPDVSAAQQKLTGAKVPVGSLALPPPAGGRPTLVAQSQPTDQRPKSETTVQATSATTASSSGPPAGFPPVIMYHEIRAGEISNEFDVRLDDFRRQLDWLQAQGYRTLSIAEVEQAIRDQDLSTLANGVVLTFDDGYLGNLELAIPELRRRNMKANFFVHTAALERGTPIENYPQLTWEQLREIDGDPLFCVYSHTVSHPNLTGLSDADLARELQQSRTLYEERLGGDDTPRNALSYPMGFYDERVIRAAIEAHYTMAFAVADHGDIDLPWQFSIPRIYMGDEMSDMQLFTGCVQRYLDQPAACFVERWKPIPKD